MHVIGTAGHVDHGKSTLVQALTGIDPDRFEEEKRRGLTIDLGFAWLELPSGGEVGIIDVPGHERFIKNMLAGAGGISIALFVVAANEGWKPQSAEHLAILDILGVRHGVVAVTKADAVDKDQLDYVVEDTRERLGDTSLAGLPIVPCSAVTGEGLPELVQALDEQLAAAPEPPDLGRPRLWVDRVFTISGAGTVVTGTSMGGRFAVQDEVEIAPEGRKARIRKIQSHKKEATEIGPGNRVALNLAGLERQGAERGDVVARPGTWRATDLLGTWIRVLPRTLVGEHELTEKGAHLLYVGSAETPVTVRLLGNDTVPAGEDGYALLYLRDPLPLQRGDRFVLRDAGRVLTFGGGIVLDPVADRRRGRSAEKLDLLRRLHRASDEEALALLVSVEGSIPAEEAAFRTGATEAPDVFRLGNRLMAPREIERLREEAQTVLSAHHRERPLEPWLDREALRTALGLDAQTFDAFLEHSDDVIEEGRGARLAHHRVAFAPEQEELRRGLLKRIDEGRFSPPLTKELGVDASFLRALADTGDLVQVGDFYLTSERAAEARSLVRSAIEASGPKTVAEIRDLLGTSRKYAVPLCEWLDGTGATVRRGDVRLVGPKP